MRELMARNALDARRRRQLHLHADRRPQRRVPGGRRAAAWASIACRCCAPARCPCPARCRRVIRVLVHYYADEDHEPQHVYLGGARGAAHRPRVGTIGRWPSSSQSASGASPSTRPRARLRAAARTSRCWPPTSRPTRRSPAVVDAAKRGDGRAQPLSRSVLLRRCARRCADRYGVPAERIALGNGSCDILLAAGEALLEPGAEVVYAWPSFSVYPHLAAASGATAIAVAARRPRTGTTSTRWRRRSRSPRGWC